MTKEYPFKFLDSYSAKDKDLFFGRTQEIEDLYRMIYQSNMLLVYGTSGTGKTSLIQCGLAGKFQPQDWLALYVRRGNNLNDSLDKAIADAGGIHVADLDKSFKDIYRKSFRPLYLIFDQFEELFILGTAEEQSKFLKTVKAILNIEQPVKMIFSIREEYLGHMYDFEKEIPQLMRKKLRVEPMDSKKVKDVIEGVTGERFCISLKAGEEQGIIDSIFQKVRGKDKTGTIQLPYLQVFLDKLYMTTTGDVDHNADAVFSMDTINKIGDIGDILRDFLEEQVKAISLEQRVNADDIWRILSPFATLEGTKKPISVPTLLVDLNLNDDELVRNTVSAFTARRILKETEGGIYELVHDSLAKKIAEKRSDEDVALLEVKRMIETQVALNESARELFTQKQVGIIDLYWNKLASGLNDDEKSFIEKSREKIKEEENRKKAEKEAEELRKKKLRRRIFAGMVIAMILMGSLAVLSYQQSQAAIKQKQAAIKQTLHAQSLALSTQALAEIFINRDVSRGIKFAEYAYQVDSENLDALRAIYASVYHFDDELPPMFYKASIKLNSKIDNAVFSPDGKKMAIACVSGPAVIIDVKTGRELFSLGSHYSRERFETPNQLVVFSPDSKKIFTAFDDKYGKLWDANSGKLLDSMKGYFIAAAFSPAAKRLATGSGSSQLWNLKPLAKMETLRSNYFVSPNGKMILVSSPFSAKICNAENGEDIFTFYDVEGRQHNNDRKEWNSESPGANKYGRMLPAVFSPDGKKVYAIIHYQAVRSPKYKNNLPKDILKTWNTENGHEIESRRITSIGDILTESCKVSVSPDGKVLFIYSKNEVGNFSTLNFSCAYSLITHEKVNIPAVDSNTDIIFNDHGKLVMSTKNNIINVYDNNSFRLERSFSSPKKPGEIVAGTITADGENMLIIYADNTIKLWNFKDHDYLKYATPFQTSDSGNIFYGWPNVDQPAVDTKNNYSYPDKAKFPSLVLSPNKAKAFALVPKDTPKMYVLFDLKQKREIVSIRINEKIPRFCKFSPNDRMFFTNDEVKNTVIWDMETGKELDKLSNGEMSNDIYRLKRNISPNNGYLVYNKNKARCILYDLNDKSQLAALPIPMEKPHSDTIGSNLFLAFSKDNKKVIIGYSHNSGNNDDLHDKTIFDGCSYLIDPKKIIKEVNGKIGIPDLSADEKVKYGISEIGINTFFGRWTREYLWCIKVCSLQILLKKIS
jgi:WD40 repeat protein